MPQELVLEPQQRFKLPLPPPQVIVVSLGEIVFRRVTSVAYDGYFVQGDDVKLWAILDIDHVILLYFGGGCFGLKCFGGLLTGIPMFPPFCTGPSCILLFGGSIFL
jgi:hypothetical protein